MAKPRYPEKWGHDGGERGGDDKALNDRVADIEQALWGPPRKPNGLVGDVAEIKALVQRLILGLLLAGVGAVVARTFG